MNTTALTDFLSVFFCVFAFFCFCCVRVFWGLVLRGMKNKNQQKAKPKNKKGSRTTRCKQENHLALFEKRHHKNKLIQINRLKWKTTKNKQQQKHETEKYKLSCNQHDLKTLELQGNTVFFIVWKQHKKQNIIEHQQNRITPKTSTNKTERQKHKIWKHKQKQHNK